MCIQGYWKGTPHVCKDTPYLLMFLLSLTINLLLELKSKKNERQKNTTQWDITSHLVEWLLLKKKKEVSAGENVEKRERFFTVGGNGHWYSHHGDSSKN